MGTLVTLIIHPCFARDQKVCVTQSVFPHLPFETMARLFSDGKEPRRHSEDEEEEEEELVAEDDRVAG